MVDSCLTFRFEKKELKSNDDNFTDLIFKGIRCTEDVAYKLVYLLSELIGLDGSFIEIEDEDGVGSYYCGLSDVYADVCDDEEVEDNICNN